MFYAYKSVCCVYYIYFFFRIRKGLYNICDSTSEITVMCLVSVGDSIVPFELSGHTLSGIVNKDQIPNLSRQINKLRLSLF